MIINKVIQGGSALLDLTQDTVNENNLLLNETAHNREGEPIIGTHQSGGAVNSVNGKTGDVVLNANDVDALPSNTPIPTKTSDLTNDSGYVTASILPIGGTTGQVLAKKSNSDYDLEWANQSGGSGAVNSVNGKTGTVILDGTDIILASALPIGGQNRAEVEEAISALNNAKVDKVTGKGLSTEDFTTSEKTKLDNLANIKLVGSGLSLNSSTGELTATGGSGGGHTILDSDGVTMPQRSKLKFVGCTVSDDSTNDTTIVEAEGGGSSVVASLSITTNNSAFYGQTVTVKDSNGDTVNTGVFSNSGTVSIGVVGANYYTAIVTAYGATVSQQVAVTESGSYNVALNSDTILGAWINKGGLDYTDYANFAAVEADEEAVRRLMTIHASVDYLAECGSATDSLVLSIINSDICAKWINLRDYALDTLYANTYIASMMDTADKYFYGEWVITDNTTTPPTWGAKGNVPVMTANDAPYGTAFASTSIESTSAWQSFDGDDTTRNICNGHDGQYIGYKFTNPICVRRVKAKCGNYFGNSLQGSNDGTTWISIDDTIDFTEAGQTKVFDINNDNYYLYYRVIYRTGSAGSNWSMYTLQFYGRELRESVPTMTSNTAPYGVASVESDIGTDYTAWKAFNNDSSTYWLANSETWIQYEFNNDVVVKMFSFMGYDYNNTCNEYKIFGIDDSDVLHEVAHDNLSNVATLQTVSINNSIPYKKWRFLVISDYSAVGNIHNACARILNFYGLNYSEYDWDAEHPRKYLYDHGVELETIETHDASSKEANSLNVAVGASTPNNYYGLVNTTNMLDLSLYLLERVIIGKSIVGENILQAQTEKTSYNSGRLGYRTWDNPFTSRDEYFDTSAINQSAYVSIMVTAVNCNTNIDEWWLE